MQLYPFQVEGANWLAKLRRACLFDQAGLGKTLSAIRGAQLAGARKVLVLAPTVVLWNWRHEILQDDPRATVQVLDGEESRMVEFPGPTEHVEWIITTHGLLLQSGIISQIVRRRWPLVVVDEAQIFRGPTSGRTNALYDLHDTTERVVGCEWAPHVACAADRVWLLSGTPMPNNASELFTHLRGLFPERLPRDLREHEAFLKHFCHVRPTRYGWKVIGNKNLPQLKAMLKGIVLRRLKKNVLKELPPIRYEVVTLRPAKMPWEIEHLNAKLGPTIVKELREAAAEDGSSAADVFRSLKGDQEFSRLRHLTGLAKVEPVAELVKMEAEAGDLDKVFVAAWHLDVIEHFRKLMEKAGLQPMCITGSVSGAERQRLVERFQTDPKCRVAIGQIVAAGVGITLHAAADVILLESSTVPGENSQVADRLHRIGQQKHVRVRFVALADTADEDMIQILKTKTQMIREVFE